MKLLTYHFKDIKKQTTKIWHHNNYFKIWFFGTTICDNIIYFIIWRDTYEIIIQQV